MTDRQKRILRLALETSAREGHYRMPDDITDAECRALYIELGGTAEDWARAY